MRRHALLITAPACAAVLGLAPMAARADVIPAPPAQASGVAAQVGSILDISKTDATAGSGTASADASVLRLGGEPVLDLGGTQQGDGETGGSLLDTGQTLPAQVQVAPWRAAASGTQTSTRQAHSSAAVARADVPNLANVGVLTSQSDASHTDQKSSGTAVSDGADLGVLDTVRVVVLHSEVSSDGRGSSYLVGLNGTEIGTDEQLGATPLCALNVPSLLGIACLSASGGAGSAGSGNGAAQVVQLTPALDALATLNPVAAFTAAATSGTGQAPAITAPAPTSVLPAGEISRAGETAPAAAGAETAGGALPRTGTSPAPLAAASLAMVAAGFVLRRFRLRATAG